MQGLSLSPVGLFLEASLVGKAVMAALFLASLWSWVLIIEGVVSVMRLRRAVQGRSMPVCGVSSPPVTPSDAAMDSRRPKD